MLVLSLTGFEPKGNSEASLDLPTGLSHRPRDESVVTSLWMNDPQPKGHMASYIRRRKFLASLGGAAAWPLAARAQQREGVRRIGVLIGVADDAETKGWVATFRKRLDELGWRAGDNLQIEERWTAGDPDSNRAFAGELVAVKPDAIFAFSSVAVVALQHESRTVPIVFNSQSCS